MASDEPTVTGLIHSSCVIVLAVVLCSVSSLCLCKRMASVSFSSCWRRNRKRDGPSPHRRSSHRRLRNCERNGPSPHRHSSHRCLRNCKRNGPSPHQSSSHRCLRVMMAASATPMRLTASSLERRSRKLQPELLSIEARRAMKSRPSSYPAHLSRTGVANDHVT
jgi:hypothetical protein